MFLSSLLAFCIVEPTVSSQSANPEEVNFCDLIREAAKYEGHLVRIAVYYGATAHAALVTGKGCPSSPTEKYFAALTWGHDFDLSSKNAKSMFGLVKNGHTAEVTLVCLVHAGEKYGFYDAQVQLELKKIEAVRRYPSS